MDAERMSFGRACAGRLLRLANWAAVVTSILSGLVLGLFALSVAMMGDSFLMTLVGLGFGVADVAAVVLILRLLAKARDRSAEKRSQVTASLVALLVLLALVGVELHACRSFTDAMILHTVAPTKADMRSIATALEAYRRDHAEYPPMLPLADLSRYPDRLPADTGQTVHSVGMLTTPVSYMSSMPFDRYAPTRGTPLGYYLAVNTWVLYSAGPDVDYDLPAGPDLGAALQDLKSQGASGWLANRTFDATNGAQSSGDIIRWGPR